MSWGETKKGVPVQLKGTRKREGPKWNSSQLNRGGPRELTGASFEEAQEERTKGVLRN